MLYNLFRLHQQDGVAIIPIYGVVVDFCSFGILFVWPYSQKCTTPCLSKLLLSHVVW